MAFSGPDVQQESLRCSIMTHHGIKLMLRSVRLRVAVRSGLAIERMYDRPLHLSHLWLAPCDDTHGHGWGQQLEPRQIRRVEETR